MKKLLIGLFVIFTLVGCSTKNDNEIVESKEITRFDKVEAERDGNAVITFIVIRDNNTGVCYLLTRTLKGASMTPLYNADGTLMVDEVVEDE